MSTPKLFLILSLFTNSSHAANNVGRVSCTAIYRTLDSSNHSTEEKQALVVEKSRGSDQQKYSAELEGKLFFVTEDLRNNDIFGQIISSADETKGTVSRGALDSTGRFTATEVVGTTVYRLECQKATR